MTFVIFYTKWTKDATKNPKCYFFLKSTLKWHLKVTGWVVLLFKSTNLYIMIENQNLLRSHKLFSVNFTTSHPYLTCHFSKTRWAYALIFFILVPEWCSSQYRQRSYLVWNFQFLHFLQLLVPTFLLFAFSYLSFESSFCNHLEPKTWSISTAKIRGSEDLVYNINTILTYTGLV